MKLTDKDNGYISVYLIVFLIVTALLAVLGYMRSSEIMNKVISETEKNIKVVNELKTTQVINWKSEIEKDVSLISDNYLLVDRINKYLKEKKDKEYITKMLESYCRYDDFVSISFLDNNNKILLYSGERGDSISGFMLNIVKGIKNQKKVYFSDIRMALVLKRPIISVIVPIIHAENGKSGFIGNMYVRINPASVLYPTINSNSYLSKSCESLLLQRKKDSVFCLSELKFKPNSAIVFSTAIKESSNVLAKAGLGREGVVNGKDYRGKDVVAVIKHIPGTPWIMLTKTDYDEIKENTTDTNVMSLILTGMLILTSALIMGFLWRSQRVKYYRDKYLVELETRKLNQELLEVNLRNKEIVEGANEGIVLFDTDMKILIWNKYLETNSGYSEEEVKGKAITEVLPFLTNTVYPHYFKRAFEGNASIPFLLEYEIPKNHKKGWTLNSIAPLKNTSGEITGAIGVIQDITEFREIEREKIKTEQRLSLIVEQSPLALIEFDMNYKILTWNKAAEGIFGYTKEEMMEGIGLELIIPDDKKYEMRKLWRRVITETGNTHHINENITKDGRRIICDWFNSPINNSVNNTITIVSMGADITERQRIANALYESEAKFRSLFEQACVGLCYCKTQGEFIRTNNKFSAITGYSSAELSAMKLSDIMHGDDVDMFYYNIQRLASAEISDFSTEERYIAKDGKIVWCNITASAVYEKASMPNYFIAVIEDITDKKNAETALKKSEFLLNETQKMAQIGGWEYDVSDGKFTWTDEVYNIYGVTREFDPNNLMKNSDFFLSETKRKIEGAFHLARNNSIPFDLEVEFVSAQGLNKWLRVTGAPVVEEGQIIKVVGNFSDITDRKKTEVELRQMNERFILATKAGNMGVWEWDILKDVLYLDSLLCSILYVNESSFAKGLQSIERRICAEDKARVQAELHEALTGNTDLATDFGAVMPDNSIKYLRVLGNVVKSSIGNPVKIIGVAFDVTERRLTMEKIQLSERKYRQLFENMTAGFALNEMIYDENGKPCDYKLLELNPAYEKMLEISADEAVGKRIKTIRPETKQHCIDVYENVAKNGEPLAFQSYARNVDKYYDIWAFSPQLNQFALIVSDVTERVKSGEELKATIKEKEALIRELHHRTKNNMQVICSILGLKKTTVESKETLDILKEMEDRILSMALVHKKLYQSKSLSQIDFKEYIADLSGLLLKSYSVEPGKITLKLELESVNFLIDYAIPCGLIVNELISNSIKYAFPKGRKGEIKIWLKRTSEGLVELGVADNGIGVDKKESGLPTDSLGLQLVNTLAEEQLKGSIEFETAGGVKAIVRFKDELYEERV